MKNLSVWQTIRLVLTVWLLCVASIFPSQTRVAAEDFRITAYVVANTVHDEMDFSHFSQVTDFILFGVATFNEDGEVILTEDAAEKISILRNEIDKYENKRFYLSMLGPGSQTDSSDWNEQMADQAQRHTNAFASGKLEKNILTVLGQYGFDGVFFDYEYPLEEQAWDAYNNFIVSLDECLTDAYRIGIAVGAWNLGQNKQAQKATDLVVLMSYDTWAEDGTHAPVDHAINDLKTCRFAGYDMAKVDLGLPFYGRPTNHDAYWYAYKDYCDRMDENGLVTDTGNTELVFSFNTCEVIKEKTALARKVNAGGVMVWHYACDTPSGSGNSLFDAAAEALAE